MSNIDGFGVMKVNLGNNKPQPNNTNFISNMNMPNMGLGNINGNGLDKNSNNFRGNLFSSQDDSRFFFDQQANQSGGQFQGNFSNDFNPNSLMMPTDQFNGGGNNQTTNAMNTNNIMANSFGGIGNQSVNQSNQPNNQSNNQPISQPANQSFNFQNATLMNNPNNANTSNSNSNNNSITNSGYTFSFPNNEGNTNDGNSFNMNMNNMNNTNNNTPNNNNTNNMNNINMNMNNMNTNRINQGNNQMNQMNNQLNNQMNSQMNSQVNSPMNQLNNLTSQMNPQQKLEADRKRVTLILEINQELLKFAIASANDTNKDNPDSIYVSCMKRLQCNLAYLASLADKSKSMQSSFPQILSPPPEIPSLQESYRRLQLLFPEVIAFMKRQLALKQQKQQQQQQQQQQQLQQQQQQQRPQTPQFMS